MAAPITNDDRFEWTFDENERIMSRMQRVFDEYNKIFTPERELEIKKLTIKYLLEMEPNNETYIIEKYALEGRDYLSEKAEQERKEKEYQEKIAILREKERIEKEENIKNFEKFRKTILEELGKPENQSSAKQAELEAKLLEVQKYHPVSDEEIQRRMSRWKARENYRPERGSRVWIMSED